MRHQGDVNHITGDAHNLVYFLKRKRTILTILDCERLMGEDLSLFKKKILKFLWFTVPKWRCRYITTISEESSNNLALYAGIDKQRIRVINVGVDQRFRPLGLTADEKNVLLKKSGDKKAIMHISGPLHFKNLSRVITAINGLGIKIIKVGGFAGGEKQLLKEYGIEYLHFKNIELELLVKIYNAVDCLVAPSLIEGFCLPIVEAQRCGCPVVTSNISCLPEVAGEGALFVDPYSLDSIQDGIRNVLADEQLRLKLVRKGFENAKRFEWSKIAPQYYELYKEVISFNAEGGS